MRYLKVKSKIFMMYLRGIRGFFENKEPNVNKRKTKFILTILGSFYCYGWISHNCLKHVIIYY